MRLPFISDARKFAAVRVISPMTRLVRPRETSARAREKELSSGTLIRRVDVHCHSSIGVAWNASRRSRSCFHICHSKGTIPQPASSSGA
jgi:hypothetical protein